MRYSSPRFHSQSKHVWVWILGKKNDYLFMFGPYIRHVILYAHAEHAVRITKRKLSMRASKLTKKNFQSLSCQPR